MIDSPSRKLAGALLIALALLALSGCGRRGMLEPPPADAPDSLASAPAQGGQAVTPGVVAQTTSQAEAQTAANAVAAANPPPPSLDAAKTENPGLTQSSQPAGRPPAVTPAMNSFFLDPLLK